MLPRRRQNASATFEAAEAHEPHVCQLLVQTLVILLCSLVSSEARLGLLLRAAEETAWKDVLVTSKLVTSTRKNLALALLWIFSKLLGRTGSKPPWLAEPPVGAPVWEDLTVG